jgi:thioredoxin-like negative regulator of GroEL
MQQLNNVEELEEFIATQPFAFLYVSQPTCSVCQALLPKIKAMLEQFPNLQSAYVDTSLITEVVGKFSVFTIPVLLLFIDGKEVMRKARYLSVDDVEATIAKYNEFLMEA